MKTLLLIILLLSLNSCYRNYRHHGDHYGDSDGYSYSERAERDRHRHMDAEREHLRQEEEEDARIHGDYGRSRY